MYKIFIRFCSTLAYLTLIQLTTYTNLGAQKFLTSEWFANKKEIRDKKIEEGRTLVTPLIGPAYTPELKFIVAGGIMVSFKGDRQDSTLQRSSLPMILGVSSSGAFFFESRLSLFFLRDKLRIYGDVNFRNLDDHYWGVGYKAGRFTEKSDSLTAYNRTWWQINPKFLWQFKKNYFVGPMIDFNYTKGSEASSGVSDDPAYQKYNDRPFNSGLGIVFQHDTRDIAVNAYTGAFIEFSAIWYGSFMGGKNNYSIYALDLRRYFTLGTKEGRTLALQARARIGINDVPYGEMSQLGTPWDLRGYFWGRYRDRSMLFGIAEYRHRFYRKDGQMSKHGVVGWVGLGSIADKVSEFSDLIPNGGIGYRFEVQPRTNVRLDFGFGEDAFAFYFNFNEAF